MAVFPKWNATLVCYLCHYKAYTLLFMATVFTLKPHCTFPRLE